MSCIHFSFSRSKSRSGTRRETLAELSRSSRTNEEWIVRRRWILVSHHTRLDPDETRRWGETSNHLSRKSSSQCPYPIHPVSHQSKEVSPSLPRMIIVIDLFVGSFEKHWDPLPRIKTATIFFGLINVFFTHLSKSVCLHHFSLLSLRRSIYFSMWTRHRVNRMINRWVTCFATMIQWSCKRARAFSSISKKIFSTVHRLTSSSIIAIDFSLLLRQE